MAERICQGTDTTFCVGGINTAADIAICIHRPSNQNQINTLHLTQCCSVQRKVLPIFSQIFTLYSYPVSTDVALEVGFEELLTTTGCITRGCGGTICCGGYGG